MPDAPRYEHSPWIDGAASLASSLPLRELEDEGEDDANMTKVRVLLGLLAVLVLVGSTTGCGLVSDQTKQDAKKKVESKAQQAKQEAKKKIEAKGQQARQTLKKKQLSWMSRGKVVRRPPRGAVFEDGVEDREQLAHAGYQSHLLRFAGR